MTHAIDGVFIDAILVPLLRELGLPAALPLAKLSSRMKKWVLGEAACLQRAMSHPTFAMLVEYGDPLRQVSEGKQARKRFLTPKHSERVNRVRC